MAGNLKKKVCDPADGPFEHTLFLGLSVQSVSLSQGWNSQQSTLTIQLVEDTCAGTKYYFPAPGQKAIWKDPDPGFVYPNIGGPAYFRIGDFEFAGLVQNWELKESTGGQVFSVTLCDPRLLLENLSIIISDYADSVENVYNLINPYGFLESLGFPCQQQFIKGASFGSPAGGYGGAQNNNEGTPYNLLRNATAALLSGYTHPKFSPYGKAVFRGHNPTGWNTAVGGCGALVPDGFSPQIIADYGGNGYTADYIVDISEIPFNPAYFRLAGPQDTLMNIISNACSLTGCDFFIELLITPSGDKIIKIRTTKRRVQPTLGEIEDFVANTEGVTDKNIGRELRNETTSTFLYGGYIQSIYEEDAANPVSGTDIIQHWGFNASGTFNVANLRAVAPADGQWEVQIDLRDLNLGLVTPLLIDKVFIYESEMRCALGEYDTWFNFIQAFNENAGTPMGLAIKAAFPNIKMNIDGFVWKAIGVPADRRALGRDAGGGKIVAGAEDANDITGTDAEDIKKIHKFVANFADTYYGKQFLVRLPFVCYRVDEDSGQTLFSDNPTNDGGWPAQYDAGGGAKTDVLGLAWKPTPSFPELETFRDDQGKIHSFVRFDAAPTGAYPQNRDDSVILNSGLYLKANADEKVYEKDGIAAVVIKLGQAVAPSKNEDGVDKRMAGGIAIAVEALAPADRAAGAGAIVANFEDDQDGQKGDFALAMETKRLTPDDAAIAMISNTDRYGPYGFSGPPGQVKFESADTLTPWGYDGYVLMDAAGIEMAKDSITFMQVGEKGGITVPGYPTKRLGQELRESIASFGNSTLTRGTFSVGSNSIEFFFIPSTTMTGDFGPNITSISISMGTNGVTTTYQFNTFSPTFGKFAKYNANRLQKMSKRRQEIARRNRIDDKINKRLEEAEAKINRAVDNVKAENPAKNVGDGVAVVLAAEQNVQESYPGQTDFVTYDGSATTARKMVVGKPNASGAMMSWDGLIVPVSRSGDGGLPRYVTPTGSCPALSGTTYQMDPPMTGYTEPIINTSYLDPFATVNTPKHADNPNDSGFHNHVRRLAHSDYSATGGTQTNMKVLGVNSGDFPEDFRFLALKGPLLIHGWGYDLEGKPIPNKVDTVSDASIGVFEGTGLHDKFLDKWLRKPQTWPTAPLDVRFDRARGVWTIPSEFRIVQVEAVQDIEKDETGVIKLTNLRETYDASGALIVSEEKQMGVLKNPTGVDCPEVVESGDKFYAFYDTADCYYYALPCPTKPCFTYMNSGCASGTGTETEPACITGSREDPIYIYGPGISGSVVGITGLGDCSGCLESGETGVLDKSAILIQSIIEVAGDGSACEFENGVYTTGSATTGGGGVFEKLTFGKGLSLSSSSGATGQTLECEYDVVLDTKIKDDPYCDWTGTEAAGAVTGGYSYYDRLNLGTGLRITEFTECGSGTGGNVVTIAADHSVGGENTPCSSGNVEAHEFFNKLTFRSGISVTSGTGSCDYFIDSPMPEISDSGYCNWIPEVAGGTGCIEPFKCLTLGSGLKLGEINADIEDGCSYIIHADHYLKDTAYCDWEATVTGYEFFNRINFESGLQVIESGDCEYTIRADHYIQDYSYCDWTPVAALEKKFFNKISVGTGLWVDQGEDEDCDFKINADHKITDVDYCDHEGTITGYEFFNKIAAGTGLKLFDLGECSYRIDADHEIRGLDYCLHEDEGEEEYGFFNKLTFDRGLQVTKGEEEEDCDYIIKADHFITSTAYCGIAGLPKTFFNNLTFAEGLWVDGDDCDFTIHADHYIKDEAYCNHVPTVAGNSFFNNLWMGTGLKVELVAGGGACTYRINADHNISKVDCDDTETLAPTFFNQLTFWTGIDVEEGNNCEWLISSAHKVQDIAYCDWTPVAAATPSKYENLYFGTGLKMSSYGDCGYSIDADHYIKDEAYCNHTPTVAVDKFFNKLWAGTGLKVELVADCTYRINADHYIKDLDYCDWTATVGVEPNASPQFFNNLELGTGLRGYFGSNDCIVRIDADHYIKDEGYCNHTPTVAGNPFFTNLRAGTGLQLVEVADCDYRINADHYIIDEPYCNWTPPANLALTPRFFNRITAGIGLWVNQGDGGECDWKINADHEIKDSSYCDWTAGVDEYEFFNRLNFGSGLQVVDEGECEYLIRADHYIQDSGYCDHTPSIDGPKFFNTLVAGTGLKVISSGDCTYRIDADHYISSTGSTCSGTEKGIDKKFFNHLTFGTGIGVKDLGDCKYEIYACGSGSGAGVQVKDSGYCDWTPTVATTCTDTSCIRFGSGLKIISLIDGESRVDADHYVKDEAYCDHTPAANVADNVFFNKLWAGTGLKVELVADCTYRINADHYIKGTTYCNDPAQAPPQRNITTVPDYKFFNKINFDEGLYVTKTVGDNCEYTIKADHRITDNSYCNWTPTVGDEFFKHLRLGKGLKVDDNGNCDFTINADHYIKDLDYCDWTASVGVAPNDVPQFFNNLELGTGLKGYFGSNNCIVRIDADHYITDTTYCNSTPTVSNKFFNHLRFGKGLWVDGDNCDYTINADHYIVSSGSKCFGTNTSFDPAFFTHLSFTDGMGVRKIGHVDSCAYEIWSCSTESKVRDSGYCDWDPDVATTCTDVDCIVFGTGLKIMSIDDDGNAVIQADHHIYDSGYCEYAPSDPVEGESRFFDSLIFGSGLKVHESGDGACNYLINVARYVTDTPVASPGGGGPTCKTSSAADKAWYETLHFRSGIHVSPSGGCDYIVDVMPHQYQGPTTCTGFIAASSPAIGTAIDQVFDGPGIAIKQDTNPLGTCGYAIGTDFTFYNPVAATGFQRPLDTIRHDCGIEIREYGACGIDIYLDPQYNPGSVTGVKVVRDVCCTGDQLQINYVTLRFSECGLFTGIIDDGGFCDC